MLRKCPTIVVSLLCASSVVGVGGSVAAQIATEQPKVKIKACLAAPATKTLTHQWNAPPVEAKSGTAYDGGECTSFVVDVVVPSDHGRSDRISIDIDPGVSLDTKAACEGYLETYEIYRTSGGTTRVAGTDRRGQWKKQTPVFGGKPFMACQLSPSVAHQFMRPTAGSASFRVLVAAKKNDKTVPVVVRVSGLGQPPG